MARVGRTRNSKNARLPKGWLRAPNGIYYFRPTNKADAEIVRAITGGPLSLRLGASHDEAAVTYAKLIVKPRLQSETAEPGTISELCRLARLKFLPTIKSEKTKTERTRHIDKLELLFGKREYAKTVFDASKDSVGRYLRAMDVQRHLDEASEDRPVAANREVKSWSLVFKWAITRWGLTTFNPCVGVMTNPEHPRDVAPSDKMIFGRAGPYRKLTVPGRFVVAMYRYYGRRKGETVKLQLSSEQADGLHFRRGKSRSGAPGKEIIHAWDPMLTRMWARLMAWRRKHARSGKVETLAALVNMRGGPYKEGTFNCDWRRAMKASPTVRGTFTVHDIRASAAGAQESLAEAQKLLAHDEQGTTGRVYRRGPHVIDMNRKRKKSDAGST